MLLVLILVESKGQQVTAVHCDLVNNGFISTNDRMEDGTW